MRPLIPLRMLNEFVYCPRLFHLEHVQGLFRESADTVRGANEHERARAHRTKVRRKAKPEEAHPEEDAKPLFAKTMELSSERLGLVGRLDAVEEEGGALAPVEDKKSAGPSGREGFDLFGEHLDGAVWPPDQVQLCGQGLLLRDNGFDCDHGILHYRAARKRVRVEFTPQLMRATLEAARLAREAACGPVPPPLVDSPKCAGCSLNAFCLPDEINALAGRMGAPRRIVPGRDDAGVLYVLTQGARVSKTGESLVVQVKGEKVDEIPLKDVAHAALFGHVQISTEAIQLLLAAGRTVSFLSAKGRLLGVAHPPLVKNVRLRQAQYRLFDDEALKLKLSRCIVEAKIENQRTLLRRNAGREFMEALKELSRKSADGDSLETLRGLEGNAARLYFNAYAQALRGRREEPADGQWTFDDIQESGGWNSASISFFRMEGRNRRPPRDPVNAMLSFGYALLARDLVAAIIGTGLDPYCGFYHAMEAGRPALALDLMETFRPVIVDSVVLRLVNTNEMRPGHFQVAKTEVLLSKEGRARFLGAYERRMDELVTHPVFGYRISYRRVLDVECRLLGRFLEGEIPDYRPLKVR